MRSHFLLTAQGYTQKMKLLAGFMLLLSFALAQTGAQVYQQSCVFCHGERGQGRAGAFPPLAAHTTELIKTPEGRAHLINVMLFGMQGPVRVRGNIYDGVMPAFAHLTDEQIAAVLNHTLTAWGNDRLLPRNHRPITAAEVANARNVTGNRPTPREIGINRARINVP
jgi:mono/diheme cytochrome c family protein